MRRSARHRFSLAFVSSCLAHAAAYAQSEPATAATPQDVANAVLEDVLVTAQRHAQRRQDVPISVEVVGPEVLSQQNLNSLFALSQTTPSVHVGGGGRTSEMYIRGIGSGYNQSFDQSVGTFIDDIYHGRSRTAAATFLDLERIEILKGPQTTLFGNNAIAGALNIVTRKPGDTFDASLRGLYSPDGDQYAVEGALGGPLTDTVAARVAATYNGQSGWLENVHVGRSEPREENVAGRVTVSFTPGSDLEAILKLEGSSNDGALAMQTENCPPSAPFVPAGFCNSILALSLPTGLDDHRIAANPGQVVQLDSAETALTANYRRWDHTLTSVTGYYEYDFYGTLDVDATPAPLLHVEAPEDYRQFSQELRLVSPTGRKLEYLAGIYFQSDDLSGRQDFNFGLQSARINATPALAPLVPYLPIGQNYRFALDTRTYSAFGSLSWNATDQLKLTGALRGTWVDREIDKQVFFGTATRSYGGTVELPATVAPVANTLGLGTTHTLHSTRSDEGWMPAAHVEYKIAPAAMAYASYTRGFKAGGFNAVASTGDAATFPFEPEHVSAYELGLKSEWLGRTLLLNLSLFRSDYTDLQAAANEVTPSGPVINVVRNAAQSRSHGAEVEMQWILSSSFRLSTDVTYLDARYVRYPNASPTGLQQLAGARVQDLSGEPTTFAPDWSGDLTATYTVPVADRYEMHAELRGYFSSSYYITGTNDQDLQQDDYTRLDGRLSLQAQDGRWAVDLIGKNLTNESIVVWGSVWPSVPGGVLLTQQQPRSVAVQVRYHW